MAAVLRTGLECRTTTRTNAREIDSLIGAAGDATPLPHVLEAFLGGDDCCRVLVLLACRGGGVTAALQRQAGALLDAATASAAAPSASRVGVLRAWLPVYVDCSLWQGMVKHRTTLDW